MMKMRILCLHGMYQRASVFEQKTQHLAQALDVELLFLDGPVHVVPKILRQSKKPFATEDYKAWWDPKIPMTADTHSQLFQYVGDAIKKEGNIDGVLGFSQGASMASLLCSTEAHEKLQWTPKVAVLFGGYTDNAYDLLTLQAIMPQVHSLHMYGINDNVVPAKRSQDLATIFKKAQAQVVEYSHGQGHVVPKAPEAVQAIKDFLDPHIKLHNHIQHVKNLSCSDEFVARGTLCPRERQLYV